MTQTLDYLSGLFGEVVRKVADDPQVERVVAYPSKALREAIVNAVYHRSYDAGGRPTRIALYPDRVEVTSYPGPVPGIELSHFSVGAHPPAAPARNPRVGEMLKSLRLAETWQTGVPKIHRAMQDNGSGAPRFEFDDDRTYFRVVLPAHPGYVVLHAAREATALWHQGMEHDAINHLSQALERVPTSGALVALLVEYLARTGNLEVARSAFTKFERAPGGRDRHLAYIAMGRGYLDADLTDEAAELFRAAPRPPDLRHQVDLAILHKRSRDFETANRVFTAVASQIQSDPRALHYFAQTKLEIARRTRAMAPVASCCWRSSISCCA
ncbi:MAG: hypothetical protein IPL61_03030 [Myxococcales bacterium]|nr:hypothetical protein [Myxococcales bacterium]